MHIHTQINIFMKFWVCIRVYTYIYMYVNIYIHINNTHNIQPIQENTYRHAHKHTSSLTN